MNYLKNNSNANYLKIKFLLFLFLLYFVNIYSISSSSNEPLSPNELGETSTDCSMQSCLEKDALALWLSLIQVCSGTSANPYFLEINSNETIIDNIYSPIVVGSLCAMSSIISLFIGYNYAYFYNNNRNKYFLLKN
jgi:hypothetical protein